MRRLFPISTVKFRKRGPARRIFITRRKTRRKKGDKFLDTNKIAKIISPRPITLYRSPYIIYKTEWKDLSSVSTIITVTVPRANLNHPLVLTVTYESALTGVAVNPSGPRN